MITIHDATPPMADGLHGYPILNRLLSASPWASMELVEYIRQHECDTPKTTNRVYVNGEPGGWIGGVRVISLKMDARIAECPAKPDRSGLEIAFRNETAYREALAAGLVNLVRIVRESDGVTMNRPELVLAINEDGTRGAIIIAPR
jgi:hypothetical protein